MGMEWRKWVSTGTSSSSSANECVCVSVCIVSDVIIVHTNCIEMCLLFYTHPKRLATTPKKIKKFGGHIF
jgi:hypothetical protein